MKRSLLILLLSLTVVSLSAVLSVRAGAPSRRLNQPDALGATPLQAAVQDAVKERAGP